VDTGTRAKAGTANNSFPWWSVVQAVTWIIGRSLLLVERASAIRTFAALQRSQELRPVSVGDDPPLSLAAARAELISAAKDGGVRIYGQQRGSVRQERVDMQAHLQTPWLADHGNEVCLLNEQLARTGLYWADLWVRSDECMNRWKDDHAAQDAMQGGKDDRGKRSGRLSRETDDQILDWMIRYQRNLKHARKRHGRDIILSEARKKFKKLHKDVLAIWNAPTKTRKPSSRRKSKSP